MDLFLFRDFSALFIVLTVVPLCVATLGSLILAVVQAATTVQEQTSLYLVRVIGALVGLGILLPWGWKELTRFTIESFVSGVP
jgi:flagellar biosynthesis protein FliQ